MTELIDTVQIQEVGDSLLDLFEINVEAGVVLYLYSSLDEGTSTVLFPDPESPYTVREYEAFPIELEGIDFSADGAASRPTLRVANIISLAVSVSQQGSSIGSDLSALGISRNEDLLGVKITRRRTLAKYLSEELGSGTAPIEFPQQTFILDRISGENNVVVEYELSSPFDVEGVKIPSRMVVGKYCPWKYQDSTGGCLWSSTETELYFDVDDVQITVPDEYDASTSYIVGNKVRYDNKIWEALLASLGKVPDKHIASWERIDICGKTISSCKARFHFNTDSSTPLPFGGFPGSRKFR